MSCQKNKTLRTLSRPACFLCSVVFLAMSSLLNSAEADGLSPYQTPHDREMYNTSPGGNDEISILDASNPLELMNRLRRLTAMDDATSPSDAVDEALRALELEN